MKLFYYILFKLFTFLAWTLNPKIHSSNRFFIRYFYIGKLIQLRYFFKDYLLRKPYKMIKYFGEFSPELKFVIPYAYWHYKNGTLLETKSTLNTKELYFFSKNHIEVNKERKWNDFNFDITIPNSEDHNIRYNYDKWLEVPYKEKFKNDILVFNKPLLVIANKYNSEWGGKPINFFDNQTIRKLYELLNSKFQIIYNRPVGNLIVNDDSEINSHDDFKFIINHCPEIINAIDLFKSKKNRFNNYNHFQLSLYSNCENFISVHGGGAVLASYFKGRNIIYSVKGHELFFKEFETIYPKLSGAKITHVLTYNDLLSEAEKEFI